MWNSVIEYSNYKSRLKLLQKLKNGIICNIQVLDALNGKQGVTECAFVQSDVCGTGYFAQPVELGVGDCAFSWLLFLIAFCFHPFSLGSGRGWGGHLRGEGYRNKWQSEGWGWGGISGSGCYSLRERGTETTSGCLVEGVCFFILAYLLCFVCLFFFFTEYFYHYTVKRELWFGQVDWFFWYNRHSGLVALSRIAFFNYPKLL